VGGDGGGGEVWWVGHHVLETAEGAHRMDWGRGYHERCRREREGWRIAGRELRIVWRQRHARMVERMIGRRTGTGGSGGVAYLDATALRYRIFDEIWAVRSLLLRRELTPELANEDDYRFRVED